MATREEIRDDAERLLQELYDIPAQQSHEILDGLFRQLNSQGVVIKVERESDATDDIAIYPAAVYKNEKLIHKRTPREKGWNNGVIETAKRFIEAGYVAVESLIKEE